MPVVSVTLSPDSRQPCFSSYTVGWRARAINACSSRAPTFWCFSGCLCRGGQLCRFPQLFQPRGAVRFRKMCNLMSREIPRFASRIPRTLDKHSLANYPFMMPPKRFKWATRRLESAIPPHNVSTWQPVASSEKGGEDHYECLARAEYRADSRLSPYRTARQRWVR